MYFLIVFQFSASSSWYFKKLFWILVGIAPSRFLRERDPTATESTPILRKNIAHVHISLESAARCESFICVKTSTQYHYQVFLFVTVWIWWVRRVNQVFVVLLVEQLHVRLRSDLQILAIRLWKDGHVLGRKRKELNKVIVRWKLTEIGGLLGLKCFVGDWCAMRMT